MTANLGALGITSIMAAMPSVVGKVRYAGDVTALAGEVAQALCVGIEDIGASTEQGNYSERRGNVRYVLTAEPAAWATNSAIVRQPIEIQLYGKRTWIRARVQNRAEMQGGVRLTVTAEFQTA